MKPNANIMFNNVLDSIKTLNLRLLEDNLNLKTRISSAVAPVCTAIINNYRWTVQVQPLSATVQVSGKRYYKVWRIMTTKYQLSLLQ